MPTAAPTSPPSPGKGWSEDVWAIAVGFALLTIGLLALWETGTPSESAPLPGAQAAFTTMQEHLASDARARQSENKHPRTKAIATLLGHPLGWTQNPAHSLWLGEEDAQMARAKHEVARLAAGKALIETANQALAAQHQAAAEAFADPLANRQAEAAIGTWRAAMRAERSADKRAQQKAWNQVPWLLALGFGLVIALALPFQRMGVPVRTFAVGFAGVFLLAVLAYAIAAQSTLKMMGLGYAAWAILLGLAISNTVGTPRILLAAARTEFFVKTGLVLLGAEILLGKIVAIGLPGIFVAWVVTPIVLVTTYWFGQRVLKITSRTLNMTICADMSVCGTSAAIATAAACRASKEELTLAVGISMVFTSIMMVVMPLLVVALGLGPVVGGAWLGGTIDATGAVAAAGAFLGETALHVAATVKMIQNMLIGPVAFGVAVYFTTRVEKTGDRRVGIQEIWRRFPRFVLGFAGASALFSILHAVLPAWQAAQVLEDGVIRNYTGLLHGWFFCLAFVSIGLATDFRQLRHHFKGGKPLILYVSGQALNLVLTLAMAHLMFEVVFAGYVSAG